MNFTRALLRPALSRRMRLPASARSLTEDVKWKQHKGAGGSSSDNYLQMNVLVPTEQITSQVGRDLDKFERIITSEMTRLRTDLLLEMIKTRSKLQMEMTKTRSDLQTEMLDIKRDMLFLQIWLAGLLLVLVWAGFAYLSKDAYNAPLERGEIRRACDRMKKD
jgi:hypothetical protein